MVERSNVWSSALFLWLVPSPLCHSRVHLTSLTWWMRPGLPCFFTLFSFRVLYWTQTEEQKNGWDHQMVHGVMRVTLKQPIRVRGSPSSRQSSLSPAKPNNGVCVCVCVLASLLDPCPTFCHLLHEVTMTNSTTYLHVYMYMYHVCIPSFFPDVTSHNFPSPSCLSFLYCQQWEAG